MIVGYCIINGKKWIMFEDKQCAPGEVKLTDGFKDKRIRWDSDKLIGIKTIDKEDIDLRKIAKRMRGARPWHPLIQELRQELEAARENHDTESGNV